MPEHLICWCWTRDWQTNTTLPRMNENWMRVSQHGHYHRHDYGLTGSHRCVRSGNKPSIFQDAVSVCLSWCLEARTRPEHGLLQLEPGLSSESRSDVSKTSLSCTAESDTKCENWVCTICTLILNVSSFGGRVEEAFFATVGKDQRSKTNENVLQLCSAELVFPVGGVAS